MDLGNCTSSISRLVPWSTLTKIDIDNENTVTASELEAILQIARNVNTLKIFDQHGILPRAILHKHGLGNIVNRQVSIYLFNEKNYRLEFVY